MRFDLSPSLFVALAVSGASLLGPATVLAQPRSVRDTATAYRARLNAKGLPAYTNPTAAFQATSTNDKSRIASVITPPQPIDPDVGEQ